MSTKICLVMRLMYMEAAPQRDHVPINHMIWKLKEKTYLPTWTHAEGVAATICSP